MLQIHMLSALFLILAYAILFSIGWLKSQDKWNVMKDVLFSVGVFLILTVNIWLPLLYVNATNELAAPFINKSLFSQQLPGLRLISYTFHTLYQSFLQPLFILC